MKTITLVPTGPNGPTDRVLSRVQVSGDSLRVVDGTDVLLTMQPGGVDASEDPERWAETIEAWGGNGYVGVVVEESDGQFGGQDDD